MNDLAARLGRLELVAPGADQVLVDERVVTDRSWFVNPGTHLVAARFGEARGAREITVEAGQIKTTALEPPKPPPPVKPPKPARPAAPDPAPPAPERSGWPAWAFVSFAALTAVSGGLTIASGVDTLMARSDYLDVPEDERTEKLYDEGKLKQDRTNVLIGVTSGLAVVTAVVAIVAID